MPAFARPFVVRAAAFLAAWALLTGGDPSSWLVGAPAALAAAWVGTVTRPAGTPAVTLRGLVAFVPYFVWQSLRGAATVALLALRGQRALDPVVCRIPARLGPMAARVLAANACSLLPGSLSADLDGDHYVVHALVGPESSVIADMRDVERRVAAVFGLTVPLEQAS